MKIMNDYIINSSVFETNIITLSTPETQIKVNKEGFFLNGKLIKNDEEIYFLFKNFLIKSNTISNENSDIKLNNIQQYQNLVELLRQALLFYADEKNYEKTNYVESRGNISSIDLDEYGSQARFALNKIKEIREINEKILKDYNTEIEAIQKKGEQDIINTIGILKKFGDDNNI